ncbi:hypothetical protein [Rubinisphaera brasiliensis]|uniref:Uncharacterized protein n=1 Tax=Rubinisphaera brasiliensis (strain ATCC 49424 / DSM 5305 / JCM 21570 / IAM 15109 / NBRC 103401 / IFAM 1448) TaxID=756272 RepID=F0SKR1_RUBBR|nr:hypothetical protein [Rubinisphaera brasiliensis]ADY58731.1 hypothetical protein Plabr_1113 [Rubinisphaera brasiliensis DSM 5305]
MRRQGETIQQDYRQTVLLPRPDGSVWSLTLRPLRLGFPQWLKERGLQPPTAPVTLLRDSQGRPLRDSDGQALTQRNEQSADYLLAVERYHQRLATMMVWEALQADDTVEFDTPRPDDAGDWLAFADAILNELIQAGFAAGDLIWLCEQVAVLSNLAGDQLRQARSAFFPPAAARPS